MDSFSLWVIKSTNSENTKTEKLLIPSHPHFLTQRYSEGLADNKSFADGGRQATSLDISDFVKLLCCYSDTNATVTASCTSALQAYAGILLSKLVADNSVIKIALVLVQFSISAEMTENTLKRVSDLCQSLLGIDVWKEIATTQNLEDCELQQDLKEILGGCLDVSSPHPVLSPVAWHPYSNLVSRDATALLMDISSMSTLDFIGTCGKPYPASMILGVLMYDSMVVASMLDKKTTDLVVSAWRLRTRSPARFQAHMIDHVCLRIKLMAPKDSHVIAHVAGKFTLLLHVEHPVETCGLPLGALCPFVCRETLKFESKCAQYLENTPCFDYAKTVSDATSKNDSAQMKTVKNVIFGCDETLFGFRIETPDRCVISAHENGANALTLALIEDAKRHGLRDLGLFLDKSWTHVRVTGKDGKQVRAVSHKDKCPQCPEQLFCRLDNYH